MNVEDYIFRQTVGSFYREKLQFDQTFEELLKHLRLSKSTMDAQRGLILLYEDKLTEVEKQEPTEQLLLYREEILIHRDHAVERIEANRIKMKELMQRLYTTTCERYQITEDAE